MIRQPLRLAITLLACELAVSSSLADELKIHHAQGEICGEVTPRSAILQSRLTASAGLVHGDVPGAAGVACFEYSIDKDFGDSRRTSWMTATPENDSIVKAKISDLQPGTDYFYRLIYGPDRGNTTVGDTCRFKTLQGPKGTDNTSFVVVTGMNYVAFHIGKLKNGKRLTEMAYQGPDKSLGYPALKSIRKLRPDFFVGTGDNVYYDSRDEMHAETKVDMRRKWHEQLVQPRFVELFRDVPTYWEKDDHDHRYNDCDREGNKAPSSDLGIRLFREQVPIVDPRAPNAKTYRTYRVNKHLQIWLVEGRDYRSPNRSPNGPAKTLWGATQLQWLKDTLLESDAAFKILISPTPMVGPDDAYKIDNHTNHNGFRDEGRAFFRWIKENKLDQQGFYVVCGDRHWQYHSVDPMGIEEFSCGALCDANSRIGRSPGDPKSTDPDAKIRQVYTQQEASGGFLRVVIGEEHQRDAPGATSIQPTAKFEFYDEQGVLLHRTTKQSNPNLRVLDQSAEHILPKHLQRRIRMQYDHRRTEIKDDFASQQTLLDRQTRLRQRLNQILGDLPTVKEPLNARTTRTIRHSDYHIENVAYESRPGFYVTANLYVPSVGTPPYPAVLVPCGHSRLGKAYPDYQRIGILLAKHGLVALVYDPIGQGERLQFPSAALNAGLQHKLSNVNSLLVGRTLVGYHVWDGVRSADYLQTRPEVAPQTPIGLTGNSGGGAQTMYLMAFDERIGPAAPSCHITTLERNFELGAAGDGCQSPPGTGAALIDHPDFFTIRAPKPSLILAAQRDYKDIRHTRQTFEDCRLTYALLNSIQNMSLFVADDKHSFSQPRREAAVNWMCRWLRNDNRRVSEPTLEILTPEELQATESGQTLTEFSNARSILNLNLQRAQELTAGHPHFEQLSNDEAQARLRNLLKISYPPSCQAERHGTVKHADYHVEKLLLCSQNGVPLPALWYHPQRSATPPLATLYCDSRGKTNGNDIHPLVADRLEQGHHVLSIDLRGWGETSPPATSIIYAAGDHVTAMFSFHLGEPLLGQRVSDLLTAANWLVKNHAVHEQHLHLVGAHHAGVVTLHAATLHPQFASVTLSETIQSWNDMLNHPTDLHWIGNVVPGVFAHYDLPMLARRLQSQQVHVRRQ